MKPIHSGVYLIDRSHSYSLNPDTGVATLTVPENPHDTEVFYAETSEQRLADLIWAKEKGLAWLAGMSQEFDVGIEEGKRSDRDYQRFTQILDTAISLVRASTI